MKIGCLNPTDENLFDTLEKDYIGRTTDVINFVRIICAIDGGSHILHYAGARLLLCLFAFEK